MRCTPGFAFFFAGITIVVANPLPDPRIPRTESNPTNSTQVEALETRADPSKEVKCGASKIYTVPQQKAAQLEGAVNWDLGLQVPAAPPSTQQYPKKFINIEQFTFPECPTNVAPFIEWPILRDGTIFTSGDVQGADRIILKEIKPGDYAFCGLITHDGAPKKNGFVPCVPQP